MSYQTQSAVAGRNIPMDAVAQERRIHSVFNQASNNVERMRAMLRDLSNLSDRLSGPRPESLEKDSVAPIADNHESQLLAVNREMESLISKCEVMLRRVEEFV